MAVSPEIKAKAKELGLDLRNAEDRAQLGLERIVRERRGSDGIPRERKRSSSGTSNDSIFTLKNKYTPEQLTKVKELLSEFTPEQISGFSHIAMVLESYEKRRAQEDEILGNLFETSAKKKK